MFQHYDRDLLFIDAKETEIYDTEGWGVMGCHSQTGVIVLNPRRKKS